MERTRAYNIDANSNLPNSDDYPPIDRNARRSRRPIALDEEVNIWDLSTTSRKRGCTDIWWLLVFVLYMAGMLTIAVHAVKYGNIYRLFYQMDSFGNVCGRDHEHIIIPDNYFRKHTILRQYVGQDLRDRKFSLFLDPTEMNISMKICVRQCPDEDVEPIYVAEFHWRTGRAFCMPQRNDSVEGRLCPNGPIFKSTERLLMCIPDIDLSRPISSHEIGTLLNSIYMLLQYLVADFVTVRYDILPLCVFTLGLAILMVFILQFLSSALICLLYISITFITAGFGSFCWYSWYIYYSHVRMDPKTRGEHPLNITCYLLLVLLAALSLSMLVILITMWCGFPRGKQLQKLFHEAGKALRENIFLFILPITSSLLTLSIFIAWIFITLQLISTAPGKLVWKYAPNGRWVPAVEPEASYELWFLFLFLVFGLAWLPEFTYVCHHYLTVGTTIVWYQKRRVPCCVAFGNLLRFHLGSLAFGSFVIAVFKIPRCFVLWANAKLKLCGRCSQLLLICLVRPLRYLDQLLRPLNYKAFTVTALTGFSYCKSAKSIRTLLLANTSEAKRISSGTAAVIGITEALITAIVAVSASLWFHHHYKLNTSFLVVFLIAEFAYLIAARYLSVFEVVIDTLFACNTLASFSEEDRRQNERKHREQRSPPLRTPQTARTSPHNVAFSGNRAHEELVIQDEYERTRTSTQSGAPASPPPSYKSLKVDENDTIV